MAWRAWSRVSAGLPRPGAASSVHTPAPKSAPASTVYAVRPARMKTMGISAIIVHLERHPAEAAQQPPDAGGQAQVDGDERGVADGDAGGAGDRLRGAHGAVHDPGLAADLGGDPTGD